MTTKFRIRQPKNTSTLKWKYIFSTCIIGKRYVNPLKLPESFSYRSRLHRSIAGACIVYCRTQCRRRALFLFQSIRFSEENYSCAAPYIYAPSWMISHRTSSTPPPPHPLILSSSVGTFYTGVRGSFFFVILVCLPIT